MTPVSFKLLREMYTEALMHITFPFPTIDPELIVPARDEQAEAADELESHLCEHGDWKEVCILCRDDED